MWTLPLLIVVTSVILSVPCGIYLAWIVDGRYHAPRWLRWIESRLDTGPQNWKQYAVSLLVFNTVLFAFGFLVLALQPILPFAPAGKGMLAPTTIFNSASSFFTNTDLQDYSGEQHLSYFSQIFFVVA
ncbi:MAG TPA: potassium-transporting ATPase subunit KdpA, partial [Planctomycetaceae bacterium]|nr:potassium-transporting ATPase subunit KdpA [Planctomycetaceae bacterium]